MTKHSTNDRAAWLAGPAAKCSQPPQVPPQAYRLVLLGAPGVGKGTQAQLLVARLGACHLSTGDIFRAAGNLSAGQLSLAMTAALGYMRRGELVPDATVTDLVRERVGCLRCHGGFVLDGYPRTLAQAQSLEEILKSQNLELDAVLDYELPMDEIVARLSGRRTCAKCKAVFHVTGRPPKVAGVCDQCSGHLMQREDDMPQTVKVRMETYQRNTAPLQDYYRKNGLLVSIAASGTPEEIFARTTAALER